MFKYRDNVLLNAQFKARLKAIIKAHPSQSIHFIQLINLLSSQKITMYSKAQVFKLSKFFDNPLKLSNIQTPLSYLEFQTVSKKGKDNITKVRNYVVQTELSQHKQQKHDVSICLKALEKKLQKIFGLANDTVSVSIEINLFKRSLKKIFLGTIHQKCIENITEVFLKDIKDKSITYLQFKKFLSRIPVKQENDKNDLFLTCQRLFSSKLLSRTSRALSKKSSNLQSYERKSFESEKSETIYGQRKTTIKTEMDFYQNKSLLKNDFCLSAKKCVLFQKSYSPSFSTSRKSKKISHHRKLQTQNNFFAKNKTIDESSSKQINLYSKIVKSNRKIVNQTTEDKQEQSKTEQYVVLLQNQSGVQIEI